MRNIKLAHSVASLSFKLTLISSSAFWCFFCVHIIALIMDKVYHDLNYFRNRIKKKSDLLTFESPSSFYFKKIFFNWV